VSIPDLIEQGESRAERWADVCVLGDIFTCECGQKCKLDEGVILTPDPYGIPVCGDCAMKNEAYAKWVRA
jgi:hypothetical protein